MSRLEEAKRLICNRVLSYGHNDNSSADSIIELDGSHITLEQLNRITKGAKVVIPDAAMENLKKSRSVIENIVAADAAVYGINTGFGLMSHTKIDINDLRKLQANLIRSHASGVGKPLEPDVVRRIMALRINVLARGHSGISLTTLQL